MVFGNGALSGDTLFCVGAIVGGGVDCCFRGGGFAGGC